MAIGLIVRLKTNPGKGPAFEAAFAKQAAGVRANEPANKLYQLVRSREDENSYVVMELYDNEAALEVHRSAPHMVENRPNMAGLVAPGTTIEIFDAV
ncbi:MAG TPA: antibiotic biosynthesis monooxygenase family protein [Phenylobacterium sp.]